MSQYSSIIRGLDASRRLGSELNLEQHKQDLDRNKLEKELQGLSLSRRNFVENSLNQTRQQYEEKLKQNTEISEEHIGRQKRYDAEKAKVAQTDFERNRERLLKQRNEHDELDRNHRIIEKRILDLKARSRFASEDEDRVIRELNNRKKTLLQLLDESKQRELYHYDQSKKLTSF